MGDGSLMDDRMFANTILGPEACTQWTFPQRAHAHDNRGPRLHAWQFGTRTSRSSKFPTCIRSSYKLDKDSRAPWASDRSPPKRGPKTPCPNPEVCWPLTFNKQ